MFHDIVALLEQRGYQLFEESSKGIFVREAAERVYLITVSHVQNRMTREQYENIAMRVEFMAASRYQKKTCLLHMIAVEDGLFDDQVRDIVEQVENVWIVSEEDGRIYIFENQPKQFDELYEFLEQGLADAQAKEQSLAFRVTPVNIGIVILNILYFVFIIAVNKDYFAVYNTDIMLKMGASSYEAIMQGEWYRIVASIFMHFGISHLMNNMALLTYVGCELEKRIGSLPYALLYLMSGIIGNLISLWHYRQVDDLVSAGASGAIFGVIGALFVVLLVDHSHTQNLSPGRLLLMAGITIYYGLTTVGVDNAAHIGGLISGIIDGFLLSKISQYGKLE